LKDWAKVKNRKHPAYRRVQDQFYEHRLRRTVEPEVAARRHLMS
jgi:hypothetical protein